MDGVTPRKGGVDPPGRSNSSKDNDIIVDVASTNRTEKANV